MGIPTSSCCKQHRRFCERPKRNGNPHSAKSTVPPATHRLRSKHTEMIVEALSVHGEPFRRKPRLGDAFITYDMFASRLRVATEHCIDVARECVCDNLPSDVLYMANWCVYNGWDLFDDEEIIWPNECRTEDGLLDEQSILRILWQRDRCPRWINIQVDSIVDDKTAVCLTFSCCFGRDLDSTHPNPACPFVVCSPIPPTEGWRPGMAKFPITDSPGLRYPLTGTGPLQYGGLAGFKKKCTDDRE